MNPVIVILLIVLVVVLAMVAAANVLKAPRVIGAYNPVWRGEYADEAGFYNFINNDRLVTQARECMGNDKYGDVTNYIIHKVERITKESGSVRATVLDKEFYSFTAYVYTIADPSRFRNSSSSNDDAYAEELRTSYKQYMKEFYASMSLALNDSNIDKIIVNSRIIDDANFYKLLEFYKTYNGDDGDEDLSQKLIDMEIFGHATLVIVDKPSKQMIYIDPHYNSLEETAAVITVGKQFMKAVGNEEGWEYKLISDYGGSACPRIQGNFEDDTFCLSWSVYLAILFCVNTISDYQKIIKMYVNRPKWVKRQLEYLLFDFYYTTICHMTMEFTEGLPEEPEPGVKYHHSLKGDIMSS